MWQSGVSSRCVWMEGRGHGLVDKGGVGGVLQREADRLVACEAEERLSFIVPSA